MYCTIIDNIEYFAEHTPSVLKGLNGQHLYRVSGAYVVSKPDCILTCGGAEDALNLHGDACEYLEYGERMHSSITVERLEVPTDLLAQLINARWRRIGETDNMPESNIADY